MNCQQSWIAEDRSYHGVAIERIDAVTIIASIQRVEAILPEFKLILLTELLSSCVLVS